LSRVVVYSDVGGMYGGVADFWTTASKYSEHATDHNCAVRQLLNLRSG